MDSVVIFPPCFAYPSAMPFHAPCWSPRPRRYESLFAFHQTHTSTEHIAQQVNLILQNADDVYAAFRDHVRLIDV